MRKLIAAFALFASLFAAGVAASPAVAAPGCYSNTICLHNTNTSTPTFQMEAGDTDGDHCYTLTGSANNTTSFITNNTGYTWYLYQSGLCDSFPSYKVNPHTTSTPAGSWNNAMSSIRRP